MRRQHEGGSGAPIQRPATRWLNRTVFGVGLASLFSDVGHEMATVAMPALLASLGASSVVLGLIEGAADGVASFAKLASGLYSDRLGRRKPLAVVGYFFTAAGMASFAFATSAWHVLAGRAVGWLGRGVRTPVRNVLLTEATVPETYGRAFGLERAMDSAGAVIGPLLSLVVLRAFGVRSVFLLTLIPGALAALSVALLVRERPRPPAATTAPPPGLRGLPPAYRRFLLGVGVAGLGDFSNTLLILFATQAWAGRYGLRTAGALAMAFYAGYNVVYTISCYVSGSLADRVSKKGLLACGYALAAIPAAFLLVPGASFAKFAAVFGFSGLYMGVWETVESASAAAYLPPRVRGAGFGALATVNGLGDVASSVVVGSLWAASPRGAMAYVIALSLAGAIVIASTCAGSADIRAVLACGTDPGRVRPNNEDAFVVADLHDGSSVKGAAELAVRGAGVVLAVADGMGGQLAGEVASALTLEALLERLVLVSSDGAAADVAAALDYANRKVSRAGADPACRGMGATVALVLVRERTVYAASVGDARAYAVRRGRVHRLTHDQTLVQQMVDRGTVTDDEAREHPVRNLVLQAVGGQLDLETEVVSFDARRGDRLLVCSDGLTGYVSDAEVLALVDGASPEDACAKAIAAANERGGEDNVTVIVAALDGDGLPEALDAEPPQIRRFSPREEDVA